MLLEFSIGKRFRSFLLPVGLLMIACATQAQTYKAINAHITKVIPAGAENKILPSCAVMAPENPSISPMIPTLNISFTQNSQNLYETHITIDSGTHIYGGGEVTGPLLRNGRYQHFWNTDKVGYDFHTEKNVPWYPHSAQRLYQSHPWVLGVKSDGTAFGVLFDTTYRGNLWIDVNNSGKIIHQDERASVPYAIYVIEDISPQAVIQQLGFLVGTIEMPPMWALGYQQARWSYATGSDVKNVAMEFRTRDIPCDVIWMDIDYMNGYRVFTINGSSFPNPTSTGSNSSNTSHNEGVSTFLHNNDFKGVWIVDPGVKEEPGYFVYDEGQQTQFNGKNAWVRVSKTNPASYVGAAWPGDTLYPDYTNDKVCDWWAGLNENLMANGMDGIWNDMNEPSDGNDPENVMDENTYHFGGVTLENGTTLTADDHNRYHNIYGMLMTRATRLGALAANPDKRPFVLSRSNFIGGHRYGATWTGDNISNDICKEMIIPMSINLGLSGQIFNGPDLPGFSGDTTSAEAASWFGTGAFIPFCRGHMADSSHITGTNPKEPWQFDSWAEASIKRSIERRYRLMPYIYTLFEKGARTGMPVMNPVFFADPTDLSLRDVDDCFLLGEDVLVVADWGSRPNSLSNWKKIEVVSGAYSDSYQAELYLRPGAMIPLGPIKESTQLFSYSDDLDFLAHFDTSGNATCTLYEDDRDGFGYQNGNYRRVQFDATKSGSTINLSRTPLAGNWQAENRTVNVWEIDSDGNDDNDGSLSINEQTLSGVNVISTTVTSTSGQTTVAGNFGVTVTFGENVTGFNENDIQLSDGAVTGFNGSGNSYRFTVDVSSVADGTITVTVPSSVAQNGSGDPNGAGSLTMTLKTKVSATLATASGQNTVATNFAVNVTFGEAVTGFQQNDLQLSAGSISGFSGSGASYSFTVNVAGVSDGPITISIPQGAGQDAGGLGMQTEAASLTVTLNTSPATTQGLVLYYPFDETSGTTATDSSGNGYTGSLSGTATWALGILGGACQFDAFKNEQAAVTVSSPTSVLGPLNKEVTFAFWTFGKPAQERNQVVLWGAIKQGGTGAGQIGVYILNSNNQVDFFTNGESGTHHQFALSDAAVEGKWIHWAFCKSSTDVTIYTNGVQVYTAADTSTISDSADLFTLGGIYETWQSTTWNPYPGLIDEFRMYNRALSASEVTGLMNGGGGGPTTTPPVAQISANPTSGQAPLQVQFNSAGSSDSDGNIVSYSWDFGDGTTSTQANPSHTYAAGSYTASLTVTDNDGLTGMKTVAIQANTTTPPGSLPAGYVFRVDANDVDGDGVAEGLNEANVAADGSISVWADKGSKGTTALPEVAANQPKLLVNALNGKSTVQFDGVDDFLKFDEITDVRTVLWVLKDTETDQTTQRPLLGHYNAYDFVRGAGDALWNLQFASVYVRNGSTWLDGKVTAGVNAGENLTPNQWSTVSVVTTGPTKASQITRDRAIAGRYWKGEIAELVIYNTALSDADRKSAEDFLKAKWFNTAPTSGYDSWAGSISGDSSRTGDADGDGIVNLMEYALDLNPNTSDSSGLPTATLGSTQVDYTFKAAQSDITYQVEISNDLTGGWRTTGTASTGNGSNRTIQIPLSEMSGGQLFVRLHITE